MTPEQRSEGLAAAARVLRRDLLELAEAAATRPGARVVTPPEAGTVMLEFDAPVGTFAFTEAVVTTAEAGIGDRSGWGCVLGWDEEGALACALLDALAGDPVDQLAAAAIRLEAENRDREARSAATTKVGG